MRDVDSEKTAWVVASTIGVLVGGMSFVGSATWGVAFLFGLSMTAWGLAGFYRGVAILAEGRLVAANAAYLAAGAAEALEVEARVKELPAGSPYRAQMTDAVPDDIDEIVAELRKLKTLPTLEDVEYIENYEHYIHSTLSVAPTLKGTRKELWYDRVLPALRAIVGPEKIRRVKQDRIDRLKAELATLEEEAK